MLHACSFSSVSGCPIAECVVSDSHLAFLLEDGRVCRVRYNEEQPAGASTKEKRSVKLVLIGLPCQKIIRVGTPICTVVTAKTRVKNF